MESLAAEGRDVGQWQFRPSKRVVGGSPMRAARLRRVSMPVHAVVVAANGSWRHELIR